MKRIMKDYRSITDDHMRLIKLQYPDGFGDDDLITLKTSDGIYFDALEVKTEDAVYLVRISHNLLEAIDQFDDDDDDDRDWDDEAEPQEEFDDELE